MKVSKITEIRKFVKNADILGTHEAVERTTGVSHVVFTYIIDDKTVSGFLSYPKTISNKLPVIIYNRGGSFDFGLVDDNFMLGFLTQLASWGYFVIGTQYPGNHISEGVDEFGGSDVRSVLDLKKIIDQLSFLDNKRIGMLGHSRGGMMTYLCMQQVNWIKTALTIGGMSNLQSVLGFRSEMKQVYSKAFGSTQSGIAKRSVINWVDELDKSSSLCIMHGAADRRVLAKDSVKLASKLDEIGYDYSLHVLEDGNHYLTSHHDLSQAIIKDWFFKKL